MDNNQFKILAGIEVKATNSEVQSQINKKVNDVDINVGIKADNKSISELSDKMQIIANRAEGAGKSFNAYIQKLNTKAIKDYSLSINDISESFKKAQNSGSQIDLSMANSQVAKFKGQMKDAGLESKSFFTTIKDNFAKFSNWFLIGGVTASFVRNLIDGVKFIGELDTALTNINYTMDVSNEDLKNIGNSSIQMAKDLKTSASNILQAVTIYANANETAQSILNKSQPTIMLSNVTGMSASQTADILQGTLEQFNLGEDQLLHVSDVLQKVSQSMNVDFAKGIREVAEGIQSSGSVAADAGLSLENYTALLGNLIAKTRQSGSELGRSLRTMMVRVTNANKAAVAGGEVSTEDISKAETALRDVGVEVRKDAESFRDFDDIMLDLYKNIDNISQVDLSRIAYQVAGTRQTAAFRVMIKSYGDYLSLAEKAKDADGTTLINQEKYADSLKGSYAELTASVQSLYNTLLNSDTLYRANLKAPAIGNAIVII
jgi:TP901 family phage tail tape measure protein